METMMRHCVLRRLNWVCIVAITLIGYPNYNGLNISVQEYVKSRKRYNI